MTMYDHWKDLTSGGGWVTEPSTDTQYRITQKEGRTFLDFQSASSKKDWWMSFWFWKRAVPFTHSVRAHAGFLKKCLSVVKRIEEDLAALQADKITIRGYSKGGALAVLCGMYFSFETEKVITFGAPRVVNKDPFSSVFYTNSRVYVSGDIVCNLPPRLFGYTLPGYPIRLGPKRIPRPKWHNDKQYTLHLEERVWKNG